MLTSAVAHPPVPVLLEDQDLVAVCKPASMLVHRTPMSGDDLALHQVLTAQRGERLFGVHRLDRAASGVLLFARSSEAARDLHSAVRAKSTHKDYLVVARDQTPEQFVVDKPLKGKSGKPVPSRTECQRLAVVGRHSLLRVRLRSGRRHQIRRHLKDLAHNVLGDTTHGKGRINAYLREHFGMPRLCLHAWRLAFYHPRTGLRTELCAPLPDDLRGFLLRMGADPDQLAHL